MQPQIFADVREKAVFSSARPQPQILMENEQAKVIVGSLEAGQKIPPHPEALAVYHFLEGSGWMTLNDERFQVQPGATVITPQGTIRGVDAETRMVFLAVRIA
jgi:quercetin dioxygenase-like cupin family protein